MTTTYSKYELKAFIAPYYNASLKIIGKSNKRKVIKMTIAAIKASLPRTDDSAIAYRSIQYLKQKL